MFLRARAADGETGRSGRQEPFRHGTATGDAYRIGGSPGAARAAAGRPRGRERRATPGFVDRASGVRAGSGSGLCTACTDLFGANLRQARTCRDGRPSVCSRSSQERRTSQIRCSAPTGGQPRHHTTERLMQGRPRGQPEGTGSMEDGQADHQGPEPGEAGTTGEDHRHRALGGARGRTGERDDGATGNSSLAFSSYWRKSPGAGRNPPAAHARREGARPA